MLVRLDFVSRFIMATQLTLHWRYRKYPWLGFWIVFIFAWVLDLGLDVFCFRTRCHLSFLFLFNSVSDSFGGTSYSSRPRTPGGPELSYVQDEGGKGVMAHPISMVTHQTPHFFFLTVPNGLSLVCDSPPPPPWYFWHPTLHCRPLVHFFLHFFYFIFYHRVVRLSYTPEYRIIHGPFPNLHTIPLLPLLKRKQGGINSIS